jgi:hypothetical protein
VSTAASTFGELPEVEIAIATSPARAVRFHEPRGKTRSKP